MWPTGSQPSIRKTQRNQDATKLVQWLTRSFRDPFPRVYIRANRQADVEGLPHVGKNSTANEGRMAILTFTADHMTIADICK